MHRNYLIGILLLWTQFCFGQIGFENHLIADETLSAEGPIDVVTADIDGDGDIDLIGASTIDDSITLFENIDGLGRYKQRFLTQEAVGIQAISAGDFDSDGDIDIVAVSNDSDTVF